MTRTATGLNSNRPYPSDSCGFQAALFSIWLPRSGRVK